MGRVDEAGLRHVIARVEHGDAIWVDALIGRIADILATLDEQAGGPVRDRDLLRSAAFGWLARPAELLALLLDHADQPDTPPDPHPDDTHPGNTHSDDTAASPEPGDGDEERAGDGDVERSDDCPGQGDGPSSGAGASPEGAGAGLVLRRGAAPVTGAQGGALITGSVAPDGSTGPDGPDGDAPAGAGWVRGFPTRLLETLRSIDPKKLRPQAIVYVHLHQAALGTGPGIHGPAVARVEDGGGPRLPEHLPDLLGTAHVTVKPVIDLNDRVNINAYEHPAWLRERIHLITPVEPFPHSTRTSRRGDIDHIHPYRPGPPGQTGDHNAAPLSRYAHRVKTHAHYTVRQPEPGSYAWRTPHGRYHLVDHNGTHTIDETLGHALTNGSTIEQRLALMLYRYGHN